MQLCLSFPDVLAGTVDIPNVSPSDTPSKCLAGTRPQILSNPGLSPLCHVCARWSGAVVVRRRPQQGCPWRFWRPVSPPRQPLAGLPALFPLWMPGKHLCWQSGSNPSGIKRVSMTGIPERRAWQCPRMKPWSMLEERRTLGDSRHPPSRCSCCGTTKKKTKQKRRSEAGGNQGTLQQGTATQRVVGEHAAVGAHWLQAQHLARS